MTIQIIGRVAYNKDWQGNDNISNKNEDDHIVRMKCNTTFLQLHTLAECLNRWM